MPHGKGATWNVNCWAVPKIILEEVRLEGSAHENELQVLAAFEKLLHDDEEEVGVDVTLLVEREGGKPGGEV